MTQEQSSVPYQITNGEANSQVSTIHDRESFCTSEVRFSTTLMEQSETEMDSIAKKTRNLIGFFLFGILNQLSYIIMLASAKEISDGGVALTYICGITPCIIIKVTAPYWFHHVSYTQRVWICSGFMSAGFITVAIGSIYDSLELKLLGVSLCGFQSGLGEATFLGMSSFYNTRPCLTAWASGSGLAGMIGYGWTSLFNWLGASFSTAMFSANITALFWLGTYYFVLIRPTLLEKSNNEVHRKTSRISHIQESTITKEIEDPLKVKEPSHTTYQPLSPGQVLSKNSIATPRTGRERFLFVSSLWPYMVPLFIVYYSEYAMQAGTWAAIGFPLSDESSRKAFYTYANWAYQTGAFFSRSSGVLFQANRLILWIMPILQFFLLAYFYSDAIWTYWYDWWILILTFVAGLLGGAVYVNAFTLIADEMPTNVVELALSAASVADTFGILTGDLSGLFIQCSIYKYHSIPGANVSC